MPDANDEVMHRLSQLIGREAIVEGRHVRVVDVLRENECLVLCEVGIGRMQESLYGQARRRAPRHFQIPLRSVVSTQLHPVLRAMLDEGEQAALHALMAKQ
jgi:hypothetical protein